MKDEMIYAEKLSRMIQCETISVPDVPNTEKFDRFHSVLQELFPLVFKNGEVHYIDSSILIRWQGKGKKQLSKRWLMLEASSSSPVQLYQYTWL